MRSNIQQSKNPEHASADKMIEARNEKQLPEGWICLKLRDVGKIETGTTPKKSIPEYYSNDFPFFKPSDLEQGINTRIASDNLSWLGFERTRNLPKNSVLVTCIGATIGKAGLISVPGASNQQINSIIPNEYHHPKFVYYQVISQSFQNQIRDNASSTTLPILNKSKFEQLEFVTTNVLAQQAIVSKIEELFSELDKGIENLKLAQRQLKLYRQAVLKWAFEGKLTAGRGNGSYDVAIEDEIMMAAEPEVKYQAATKLNGKNPQPSESSEKGELPEGWKWVKSGELFDFVTSGSRGWAKYYSDEGSIFVRITNLDFDSLELDLDKEKIQYVSPPSNSEGFRTKIEEGDFLFSITGYLGMFAIAPKLESAFVNQHISLCRPKDGFNKKYVGYWIISKAGGNYHLNKMTKGATKAGLSLEDIKNFPVPMAPIDEQERIVKSIEDRLSVADKMEESITQSLQQAEALRQSILKKAFEGRLVMNQKRRYINLRMSISTKCSF